MILLFLVCALALSFPPPGTCAGPTAPRTIQGDRELIEEIRKIPAPGTVVLFSPKGLLEEIFLPLFSEGKVKRIELVAPSRDPLTEEHLRSWNAYVSSLGIGADNTFRLDNGAIVGSAGELPVRVQALATVDGLAGEGNLFVDLSFFVGLYQDEARTPFVEIPARFPPLLREKGIAADRLRLWIRSRADIPLFFGYLPKLALEVFSRPKEFERSLPPKWAELGKGDFEHYLADYEKAEAHYGRFLKSSPEEPSVLFRLAQMSFVDDRYERGIRYLHRAFRADPYYIRGYSESAFRLFHDGKLEAAERVLRAGMNRDPKEQALRQNLGRVLMEQARRMLLRDPAAAEKRFSETDRLGLEKEPLDELRAEWERAKANPPRPRTMPGGMHGHSP